MMTHPPTTKKAIVHHYGNLVSYHTTLSPQAACHLYTGILLAGCSLVSRAGAPQGPTSPTYQQRTAKMKKNKNYLRFLLLLFLARRMFALEIRHGDVVVFQLVDAPVNLFNLASGHHRRRGASMFFRRRVHYGLICGPHDFCRSTGRAMMFCQYRFASDI